MNGGSSGKGVPEKGTRLLGEPILLVSAWNFLTVIQLLQKRLDRDTRNPPVSDNPKVYIFFLFLIVSLWDL